VSISFLGYGPTLLSNHCHNKKVVAPSLSFLKVFENILFVIVFIEKNTKKKNAALGRIFYLISPQ
jgi:hypothetical protein